MKNQKIGHFDHLEEGLGQGHEEVVGEVKVLQLGQVGEHHWVQVDQVVGAGGSGDEVPLHAYFITVIPYI